VYDIILSHLGKDQRNLAVDVATGSGQAAVQLAQHFKQVQAGATLSLQ
jgi:ubiquinone/menaquinone biosynthesis C-methylase UbiE